MENLQKAQRFVADTMNKQITCTRDELQELSSEVVYQAKVVQNASKMLQQLLTEIKTLNANVIIVQERGAP